MKEFMEFIKTDHPDFDDSIEAKIDRSVLRKYLYKYMLKKIRFSRHSSKEIESDTLLYYLAGKGVKDFLKEYKLTEFTLKQVEVMLDTK
jgi:hypothetical protein